MNEVSMFRLYLLRATYLFIAVGLGFNIWPQCHSVAMRVCKLREGTRK